MAQELIDKIRAAAQAKGIDPDVALRIARAESAVNPGAQAKTSSAGGLFQVVDKTWKEFGGAPGKRFDPDENIRVGTDIIASNTNSLKKFLNRDPRPAEIYAAHYFGPTGAKSFLTAEPGTPMESLFSKDVIKANPNLKGKTSDQVMATLEKKMGGKPAPVVSRETPPAPREALPPSLPPMAAAATATVAAAPTPTQAPMKEQVANLGPGYQAALALSFLADTDEKEDRDIDREPGIAEKWLAEQPSRPSVMAQFSDLSIKSPFAEPQQPQMLADGGEVGEESMPDVGKPTVQEEYMAKAMFPDLPVAEAVYMLRGGNRQSTLQGEMLSGNIGARIPLGKDAEAMLMLTGSRPERDQSSAKAMLAMLNQRLGEGNVGATLVRPMDAPSGLYAGNMSASYPLGEGRISGNVNAMRTPDGRTKVTGYGVGYGGRVGPGDLSAMLMRQKDGPYSGQIEYRLPIGRADGSPEEGERALTPQQIERIAMEQALERENASKPAFLTPKSGKGRPISTKTGELEAAALQGVTETPYNLFGAPVDLATMAMRPFGYDVEKPMGGSEDLKERALKRGIRQKPPEGKAARALYELTQAGSGLVNPAAPVRGAVAAAEKVGDAARMLEDMTVGNVQRARIRKAAKNVPEDTAYDPLRDRLEETGNLAYTFVRARPEAAARHAELEAQGLSPEQIRARNLTHKDYRGTVIEEISDAPAVVKKKTTSSPQGFYNVMEHPELQSIYPGYDMPEVMLRTTKRKNALRASGAYDSQANLIQSTVRDLPPYDALKMTRENLLHEGQHAIQDIEGFVGGANPSAFIAYVKARKGTYSPDPVVNANVIREMERGFPNLPQVTDNFTAGLANADKYKRYAAGDPDTYIGESLYRHVPGEVQAELARVRGDLTPQQLKETPHEVSMKQLGLDPSNVLQMSKWGSRPDWYIGDVSYNPSSATAQLGMIKDPGKISGPVFSPIPSADAPFVGRLDEMVANLQGPVQKDQFLGMLKGKMRDYDIARAEATLADLPGNAKLSPVDLLNRIKTQYDPSQFKTTVVPPGQTIHNYQSSDNPYKGATGNGPPLGVIHLSQSADPRAAQIEEITDMANRALFRLGSGSAFHSHGVMQLKTANDLLRAANSPILGLSESTANSMRTLGTQYRQVASQRKTIDDVLDDIFYPAADPDFVKKTTAYTDEFESQGVSPSKSYYDASVRFTKEKFEENNKILRDNNLPTVPVPDFASAKNPVLWAIEDTPRAKELKAQVLDFLNNAKKPLNESLETMKGTADELIGFQTEIRRAPPYKGQHTALKNSPDDPISFSRFSEHTTDIPGIGKADGIYVNELQSDLLDDLRKKGPKGGSRQKDEEEFRRVLSDINAVPDPGSAEAMNLHNRRRILDQRRASPESTYNVPESFAGMETSPQVAQQLMVKNAVSGAMQMGKQFVAFPGAESAQAQLYEKLGPNLKSVVKDLGPGFELRDVTLRDPDGKQLMHKAIVWGPDAAARVQKKGVPFKDGGAVERQPVDHRRYL